LSLVQETEDEPEPRIEEWSLLFQMLSKPQQHAMKRIVTIAAIQYGTFVVVSIAPPKRTGGTGPGNDDVLFRETRKPNTQDGGA
jgi:hypothetical protein